MSDKGIWVGEGIAKLRDAINDGETVKITHFALSGSANLGNLPDFTAAANMTMGTFPGQVFTGPVSYSFINDDGFLQVHAEVEADVETEFYCNGIGLIFEDVMGQKFLMAIAPVPMQQHAKMVNNTFQFVLPIVNDVADIIEVTMEPGDRVSQAQLSGAVAAHSDSTDAHADYRNADGAALLYAMDSLGIAHRNIDDNQTALDEVDDYSVTLATMLIGAIDSVGLAHREQSKTLNQRFQTGLVTILNRGVISGCGVIKSGDATRNLSLATGKIFKNGVIMPVTAQDNGALIPSNTTDEVVEYFVYLDAAGDMICVSADEVVEDGTLLYKVDVPAGNTEATDPYLGSVALTDMRRVESQYPTLMSSCPASFVGFNDVFDSDGYALDLAIESYTGSAFGVGDLDVLSRAKNGFSVQHTGIADNVVMRWTARKLDL